MRIVVPFHYIDFRLASIAVYTTTITRPIYHIHSLLYIHSLHSFTKHQIHSLLLIGVQEVEEVSGPTLQDTEQEGDTAAVTINTSSTRKQLPSHPPSEPSITQRPQLEIISTPENEPIPSQHRHHTIDSDSVPPTIRSLVEIINEETITSNPSAHDHYPDHRDYHDQRHALTSERISEGDTEDITTPLETSISSEVYNSLMF